MRRFASTRILWISLAACLVTMLSIPVASSAERPMYLDQLSLDAGLSQSSVTCVHQDSLGYMWFGTEDGLNRYDGKSFTVFKHDPDDAGSMPGNFVWAIDEDGSGDLWVATEDGGLARLDRETDRFHRVDGLAEVRLRSLHVDADGIVWVGTRSEGLRRLDPRTGEVDAYRASDGALADDHIYAIQRDGDGRLWIGTDAGLHRQDPATGAIEPVRDADGAGPLATVRVRSLADDGQGHLWVGTYKSGALRLDLSSGTVRAYRRDESDPASLAHDRVRAVLVDEAGRTWLGTSGGLDLFRPGADGFEHYGHDPTDAHTLADEHVMSLQQDRGGVLWVGTRFGGVHKWNPRTWQFGHTRLSAGSDDGSSSRIASFEEDRSGRLYVGTFGAGLYVLDREKGTEDILRHDPADDRSLSSDRVTALRFDHHGRLWAGTLDAGLNLYDSETRTFRRFAHDPAREDTIGSNGITSLLLDRIGGLWVGTFGGGVARLEHGDEGFVRFEADPEDPHALASGRVTAMEHSGRGLVWVGTHGGGLALLDPRSGRITRFRHDPRDPRSLPSDLVYSLHLDLRGNLWVGTTRGLSRLAPEDLAAGRFRNFTEKDGLPNEVVYAIEEDHQGNLWAGTVRGLARLDPRSESFTSFRARNGLQADEFNFGASYASLSGELFFGGIDGFNAFHPDRLRPSEQAPPVVLAAVSRSHQPVEGPVDRIARIDLDYRQRVVSFAFAALDFTDPDRNRFAYRLEGFDEDWVDAGSDGEMTYTNLDPGTYTLHVRAANADGVWNEEGTSVKLIVEAPPWRTPWAYSGYSAGALGLLFGFVHVQRRRVAREEEYNRVLEQQVGHRTRELAQRTSELEKVNQRLAQASITDSLTGFANRRFLVDYIEKEISLVQRRFVAADQGESGREALGLAFLMIDLDDFKTINDTFGHAAGDEVLRQLRDILDAACRQSDIVIRWGGDEFLVVARDLEASKLDELAERIRRRIAGHAFDVGDGQVAHTTCSIGYACYPFVASDVASITWEQVVGIADQAMYVSKRSGRNCWVGLASTPDTEVDVILSRARHDLRALVDEGQLNMNTSIDGVSRVVEWNLED